MFCVGDDTEAGGTGEGYVDMTSPTTVVSNPEYFSDIMTGAPGVNGYSRDVGSPRRQSHDNYYNCPPPLLPTANSMWSPPSVNRQTSQV